jgi:putative phage-type endonuclease
MKTVDIAQRSPEWLRWRAQGITASAAAVLMGISPYQTPWRLWAEITGLARPADLSGNPCVQRGIALEDAARRDFEDRHDAMVLPVCGESDDHPEIRASFDGIDDDGNPVEFKVPAPKTYAEVAALGRESPAYRLYWAQVQAQMYVAGAPKGWLVFYQGPGEVTEFEIERDDTFLLDPEHGLVRVALDFFEAVQKKKEPPKDPMRDIYIPAGEALETWTAKAGEYRDLAAEKQRLDVLVKEQKEAMEAIEDELVAMMGGFLSANTAGLEVTRYHQRGSIDYQAALLALVPDVKLDALESCRRASSERVKVTVLKEDKATVPFDGKAVDAAWKVDVQNNKGFYFD